MHCDTSAKVQPMASNSASAPASEMTNFERLRSELSSALKWLDTDLTATAQVLERSGLLRPETEDNKVPSIAPKPIMSAHEYWLDEILDHLVRLDLQLISLRGRII